MLFLACLMMLAHSMIPHHHHGTDICIYNLHGELLSETNHQNHHHDLDDGAEHQDEKQDEHCCIDDNYLKVDECKYSHMITLLGNDAFSNIEVILMPDADDSVLSQNVSLSRSTPFLISYRFLYSPDEIGLRGPPSVC